MFPPLRPGLRPRSCAIAALILILGGLAPLAGIPVRDPRIDRISVAQGLPHGTVYSVAQDAEGFLWFGTENGLARWDGYGFTVFNHDPGDPRSISTNLASHAFVDGRGRVWIGTWGNGLDRYDPRTGIFEHLPARQGDPGSPAGSRIQTIFEDRSGNLWIGFHKSGLQRFDPEAGTFTSYHHDAEDPATLSHPRVWSLAQAPTGEIWIGTSQGLDRLDPSSGRIQRNALCPDAKENAGCLPSEEVRTLLFDAGGRLWIGTREGLVVQDPSTGEQTLFRAGDAGLANGLINTMLEDRNGRIWIGTLTGGVQLWEPEATRFRVFRHEVDNVNSLSYDDVRALFQDRSGLIWVGTRGEGVNTIDPSTSFVRFQQDEANPSRSLSHQRVWAVVEDHDGDVWVGTQAGLDRIDGGSTLVEHFHYEPGQPRGLGPGDVRTLLTDSRGDLWIATNQGFLQHLAGPLAEVNGPLTLSTLDPRGYDRGVIRDLVEGPSGDLWIGSTRGVHVFDRDWVEFRLHLRAESDRTKGLGTDQINVLYFDREGILWIGTQGAGLRSYDPASERFRVAMNDPADLATLSRNDIISLHQDRAGALWVGTLGGGLNRFDPDTFEAHRFSTRDGLAGNVVHAILEDQAGDLWLSTNLGLSRFSPGTGMFRNFDAADGLQGSSFLPRSAVRSWSGQLWFGGTSGLNVFDPTEIEDSRFLPPVWITGVEVFGDRVEGTILQWKESGIRLEPNQDFLSIEYAALDFTDPGRNRYQYRLQGLDRGWVDAGNRRTAHYTNLDGGEYVFQVRGSNHDGVWSEEIATLRIRAVPHLWERTSFQSAVIGSLLLVLGTTFIVWSRRAQHAREHLETLVRQRTAELETKTAELEEAYHRVEEISFTDPLTGLGNRRYFDEVISPDVARSIREHERWIREGTEERPESIDLLFVLLDLDHFKNLNDTRGHRFGDEVLSQLGLLLRSVCRESDLVIRWGGEEFLVVSRFVQRSQAPLQVERLRRAVDEHPFRFDDGTSSHLTCSLGFCAFPPLPQRPDALSWEQTLDLADRGMYASKDAGRNTWRGLEIEQSLDAEDLVHRLRYDFDALMAEGSLSWIRPDSVSHSR